MKLNKNLLPIDTPITNQSGTPPADFDVQQEVQGRLARFSTINIKNFVNLTPFGDFTLGTIPNGQSMNFQTALTPESPHQYDPNFAQAYVGLFIGTSDSDYDDDYQIYPKLGDAISPGDWDVKGDYDIDGVSGTFAGTISAWSCSVTNNSGATGTVQFVSRWKYLYYNSVANVT